MRIRDLLLLFSAAIGACIATPAFANPTGATVVAGQATFSSQGNVLTVTASPGTIIDWQSFSQAARETIRFIQQSAASTVENRVVGTDPINILGLLQSNGEVALTNFVGATLGDSGTISVAGLTITAPVQSNAAASVPLPTISIAGTVQSAGAVSLTAANVSVNFTSHMEVECGHVQVGGLLAPVDGRRKCLVCGVQRIRRA